MSRFGRFAGLRRFVVLAALPFALACGGPSPGNPEDVLRAYSRAVQRGHLADAYALLSEDAKKTIPFAQFKRMIEENPEAAQELVRALDRPRSGPPRVTAKVTGADGEPLLLVYEGGAWRVDGSAIDLYGQATPEAALHSFVQAFKNRRYDVLLRFVPDAEREGLGAAELKRAWEAEDERAELESLVTAVEASLSSANLEVTGDRATMAYGTGGTVELVREGGAWKIEDLR